LQTANVLSSAGGLVDIKFHQLDITASESIQSFRSFVEEEHSEGIDFLINNAAVAFDGFGRYFPGTYPAKGQPANMLYSPT